MPGCKEAQQKAVFFSRTSLNRPMGKKRSRRRARGGKAPAKNVRAPAESAASKTSAGRERKQPGVGRRFPWSFWIIPVVAAAVYANTLDAEFTLDDVPIVQRNPLIRSLENVPALFLTHYWAGKDNPTDRGLYRPFTLTTYALQYAVHGEEATGYHVINVLLHALVCAMIYLFLRQVFEDRQVAFVTGLLFAVHPIHTEAVAGIVGRAEILALLGVLVCCWSYFRAMERATGWAKWAVVSVVAYALGMASKEGALLAPAYLLLTEWLVPGRRYVLSGKQRGLVVFAAYLLVACIHFLVRAQATVATALHESWRGVPAPSRVWTALRVCAEYVGLLLAPVRLSAIYWKTDVRIAESPLEPGVLLAVAFILGAAVVVAWGWKRKPTLVWGMSFFALSLFPVSNLLFPIGVLKAERLLYAPSLGFLLAIAAWLRPLLDRPRAHWPVWGALAIAAAALSVRTWNRNEDWHNNRKLAEATLKTSPDSPRFHVIMGQELTRQRRYEEARDHLEKALAQNPDHVPALNNLGLAYRNLGDNLKAAAALERLIRLEPNQYQAYVNLMAVYRDLQRYERSLEVARAALRRFPNQAAIHWNAGNLYYLLGREAEAQLAWQRARDLDPNIGL